jgi:hypothetical protein
MAWKQPPRTRLGDPGKTDGCYMADGSPGAGQDDQNPAILVAIGTWRLATRHPSAFALEYDDPFFGVSRAYATCAVAADTGRGAAGRVLRRSGLGSHRRFLRPVLAWRLSPPSPATPLRRSPRPTWNSRHGGNPLQPALRFVDQRRAASPSKIVRAASRAGASIVGPADEHQAAALAEQRLTVLRHARMSPRDLRPSSEAPVLRPVLHATDDGGPRPQHHALVPARIDVVPASIRSASGMSETPRLTRTASATT